MAGFVFLRAEDENLEEVRRSRRVPASPAPDLRRIAVDQGVIALTREPASASGRNLTLRAPAVVFLPQQIARLSFFSKKVLQSGKTPTSIPSAESFCFFLCATTAGVNE
jgi:hypothetical protein